MRAKAPRGPVFARLREAQYTPLKRRSGRATGMLLPAVPLLPLLIVAIQAGAILGLVAFGLRP